MSNYIIIYSNELQHHGIKGQRWGVRRFQNPDGSFTEQGRRRLSEYKYGANKYRKYDGTDKKQARLESARSYKRALNTTDQGLVEERYYTEKSREKLKGLENKLDKIDTKRRDKTLKDLGANTVRLDGKYAKTYEQIKNAKQEIKEHQKNIERGKATVNRLMSEATDRGYSIAQEKASRIKNTKDVERAALTGHLLFGIIGSVSMTMLTAKDDKNAYYYKVRTAEKSQKLYEKDLKKENARYKKESYSEANKRGEAIDRRVEELVRKNPSLPKTKDWTGDGTEYVWHVRDKTNDKKLSKMINEDVEASRKDRQEHNKRIDELRKKYNIRS